MAENNPLWHFKIALLEHIDKTGNTHLSAAELIVVIDQALSLDILYGSEGRATYESRKKD